MGFLSIRKRSLRAMQAPREVNRAKTADFVAESGTVYNNFGAGADITGTLPPAIAGKWVKGIVKAAHYLKFLCAGSDLIKLGPDFSGAYIRCQDLEAAIWLHCAKDGVWNVMEDPVIEWSIGT